MRVIEGSTRIAFLCYFLSHVPITICIDAQGLFGPYYPKVLTDLVAWYTDLFGDFLMEKTPSTAYAWFMSLVCCEVLFQFPFFFVAIKFIMAGEGDSSSPESRKQHYPEWFRMACIVYGTHVSTTLVPIFAAFATSPPTEMTIKQKCATIAIYSPYFIFPFWLMWLAVREDFVGDGKYRPDGKKDGEMKRD